MIAPRPSKKPNSCVINKCPLNQRTLCTPQSRAFIKALLLNFFDGLKPTYVGFLYIIRLFGIIIQLFFMCLFTLLNCQGIFAQSFRLAREQDSKTCRNNTNYRYKYQKLNLQAGKQIEYPL
jgi:hypothetical protein